MVGGCVSLSLRAPSAPASKKRIDAADHDQELVYYREVNRGPKEVKDGDESLDEFGENVQGLKVSETKGRDLGDLALSCRALKRLETEKRN